jgi:hypothetical protein
MDAHNVPLKGSFTDPQTTLDHAGKISLRW